MREDVSVAYFQFQFASAALRRPFSQGNFRAKGAKNAGLALGSVLTLICNRSSIIAAIVLGQINMTVLGVCTTSKHGPLYFMWLVVSESHANEIDAATFILRRFASTRTFRRLISMLTFGSTSCSIHTTCPSHEVQKATARNQQRRSHTLPVHFANKFDWNRILASI